MLYPDICTEYNVKCYKYKKKINREISVDMVDTTTLLNVE